MSLSGVARAPSPSPETSPPLSTKGRTMNLKKPFAYAVMGTIGLLLAAKTGMSALEYDGTICAPDPAQVDCTSCVSSVVCSSSGEPLECSFMQGSDSQFNMQVCIAPESPTTEECSNDTEPTVIQTCTGMTKWVCDDEPTEEGCDMSGCACGGEQNDGTNSTLKANGFCTTS